MDMHRFRQLPLLGILRGIEPPEIGPLAHAMLRAGLESVEITMNTAGAPALIRQMIDVAKGRIMVGAGTVLSGDDLSRALDAGATFIVMPVLVTDVVERCAAASIPVFPGALTPQEIFTAWKAGATMVKVFPASCFGAAYFKEIKGPFADIELLAVGGVSTDNMAAYFAAGASGVAFGGSVFHRERLASQQYERIEQEIRVLVEACHTAMQRPRP